MYSYRYVPQAQREVDDFPSVNLLVRRDVFEAAGGFNSKYWPGEDTKLCLKITKDLALKIIYDPAIFAWHHRRELFRGHLKQSTNYALHRGFFAKIYPETSLRPSYFIPSAFTFNCLVAPFALFADSLILKLPIVALTAYAVLLL